jgi:hypothetical protein
VAALLHVHIIMAATNDVIAQQKQDLRSGGHTVPVTASPCMLHSRCSRSGKTNTNAVSYWHRYLNTHISSQQTRTKACRTAGVHPRLHTPPLYEEPHLSIEPLLLLLLRDWGSWLLDLRWWVRGC